MGVANPDRAAQWSYVAYGNASITGSYTSALANASLVHWRLIKFYNGTDAGVLISFDGTNDHLTLTAGETMYLDLAADGRYICTGIRAKRLSGAPTTGTLYISAMY